MTTPGESDLGPLPFRALLAERAQPLTPLVSALAGVSLMTLVVSLDSRLRFAYLNPELRVSLETAVALIGLFVGVLAIGRFRATQSLGDLGVALAVFVLSFASIAFSALPRAIGGTTPETFATWAALVGRFIGATILAISPLFFLRRAHHRAARSLSLGLAGSMVAIAILAWLLASELPHGVSITLPIETSDRPRVHDATIVVVAQVLTGAMFAIATVGFARRAVRVPGDVFARWMATGAALQAGSRVHFALFPSLYSDWLYTGDVLRLAGTAAWMVGALAEITRYWHDREHLAVLDERRRLARELHDGLLQDLSFIHSQATTSGTPRPEIMDHVAEAAARALREARLAVEALADTTEIPPEVALRRAAEQIAVPAGIAVTCSFQPGCQVASPLRHDLARIVQEAATNAVKHAQAKSLAVQLDGDADGGVWLMVADDGVGFDVEAVNGDGFGLTSMRERAERIGATLTITSIPEHGTVVEVTIPGRPAGAARS